MIESTENISRKYSFTMLYGQQYIDITRVDFLYNQRMKINEWVRIARANAKLTQQQLADVLGCTKANVSAWENGRHEPSYMQMMSISALSNTPLPYDKNVAPGPFVGGEVPIISWVQAGNFESVVDNFQPGFAEETVTATVQVRRHTYALRVHGDSMEPDFKEGDILIVEPEMEAVHGSYVIAKNGDNEATFKKLVQDGGDWYLKPLNPAYPMKSLDGSIKIVGVVRQRVSKFC
ncbi:XRE family transcriptional regulator [Laribacter hongkongensis]|uniref:LexA family protein n=1 Tax=Laribacter hongkongensis TaxID=168471 RepID=UPI001EFE8989|nr:XRE family transcriptional regulator [Laribacter hongkongensis]MCG9052374.1 XRE family transcriptional regulator [Laribacter hongkongensis]